MRRLLLWLHNRLGNMLQCDGDHPCACFLLGIDEARDTVAEWFTPPERD